MARGAKHRGDLKLPFKVLLILPCVKEAHDIEPITQEEAGNISSCSRTGTRVLFLREFYIPIQVCFDIKPLFSRPSIKVVEIFLDHKHES